MEEEKQEVKEKKGTDFTTILCFALILVIFISFLIGYVMKNNSTSNVTIRKTKTIDSIKELDSDIDNKEEKNTSDEYVDKEYIMNLIENYDMTKVNYYTTNEENVSSKYFLINMDGHHGDAWCIVMSQGMVKIYSKSGEELREICSNSIGELFGDIGLYEVENINGYGEIKIYFETISKENYYSLYEVKSYSYDFKIEPVLNYYIDDIEPVLNYNVDDEKYKQLRNKLNDKYILLFKTDEYMDFFKEDSTKNRKIYSDMPYVFSKEKNDYYVELPFINIKGEGIEILNEKIKNIYEEAKSKRTEDSSNYMFNDSYYVDNEKGILILGLVESSGSRSIYVDMKSGKELTQKELLSEYGFNESNTQEEYDKMIKSGDVFKPSKIINKIFNTQDELLEYAYSFFDERTEMDDALTFYGEKFALGDTVWSGLVTNYNASSTYKSNDDKYEVENLNNLLVNNCWCEGKPGDGTGETIEITAFDSCEKVGWGEYSYYGDEDSIEDVIGYLLIDGHADKIKNYRNQLYQIAIINGYAKNDELWKNNNRIKKLKLTIDNKIECVLELNDTKDLQLFDIYYENETITKEMDFKFEILEIYKGEKYNDTCLTSLYLIGGSNVLWGGR